MKKFTQSVLKNLFQTVSIILALGVLAAVSFTSCENFLQAEDVKNQVVSAIEYNNAPYYTIDVEALKDTGVIKTPATGEIEKKVTDTFTVRFEPSDDHVFIKWEAVVKGLSSGEHPSDYIQFDNSESLETKVTLKKASPQVIVIRPVCPPRLTYTLKQGGGEIYPRDSSIEFTFSQSLEQGKLTTATDDYVTIQGLTDDSTASKYFQAPQISGKKLLFRADTSNGYIPVSNNSQKAVTVKIPKESIWYINDQYSDPVKVYLDADIKETYLIGSETSAKTQVKYELKKNDQEQSLGILKIDGEEYDGKQQGYSVGQTVSLRYRVPDGYTFKKWIYQQYKKDKYEVVDVADLSLTPSDEEITGSTVLLSLTVDNYIPEPLIITPDIYENLTITKFNLDDEEKVYERDSNIVITFNKPIAPESKDNVIIKIPGLPQGKTVSDYFEPAELNGNVLTIKAKNESTATLIPLASDGTNTITVTVLPGAVYYKADSSEENLNMSLASEKTYNYKINSQTTKKTKIKFLQAVDSDLENNNESKGTLKVDGVTKDGDLIEYNMGDKISLTFSMTKEELVDYYFKNWKITHTYTSAGQEKTDEITLNQTQDLNIDFDSGLLSNQNNIPVYGATITIKNTIQGYITIQPIVSYIKDIDFRIDGEFGKFTPAKGLKHLKLGQTNHIEFEADRDYAFIRWQLINALTGEELPRSELDGTYTYIRSSNLDSDKTDFEIISVPDEDEEAIEFELRPLVAERPQVISNTPISASGLVNKDTSIQVLFDYDMDPGSIYYDEENELPVLQADSSISLLPPVTVNGEEKYYGYTKTVGEKTTLVYKNISIINNKTQDNLLSYFEAPFFENVRTLSINAKRNENNEVAIKKYTQILVTIDKGVFTSIEGTPVAMTNAKKWVYQVNDDTDKYGPGFDADGDATLKINGVKQTRSTAVSGLSGTTITAGSLPYYNKDTFKLSLKITDTTSHGAGSGAGNTFTLLCKKEYDADYESVSNGATTKVGIDFDYVAGQLAEYEGNCPELYSQLESGIYSISVVIRDKCGNETIYPGTNDEPTKKWWICIDKTVPKIVSTDLTFADVSQEGVIQPNLDYSQAPDYKCVKFTYYYYNGAYYTGGMSKTVNRGESLNITGLRNGVKYKIYANFYDYVGNNSSSTYYTYTIPAKPKSVTLSTAYGTSTTITAEKPDNGSCTQICVRYKKAGDDTWTDDLNSITGSVGNVTASNLDMGETYEFEVCSYDSDSDKHSLPYKVSSEYPTFKTKPDVPASITADFNNSTTTGPVSWTAPANGNVTGYKVYCSTNSSYTGATPVTVAADTTSYTFTNLTPGKTYYTKVVAYYGDTDNISEAKTATTTTKPAAPTNISLTGRTNTSLTVSWTAPASGGRSYYEIAYKLSSASNYTIDTSYASSSSTSYTLTGLTGGESYNIRVRARYSNLYSDALSNTTAYQLCPKPATNIAATKLSNTSFKATWTAPSGNYDGFNFYYSSTESGLATASPINVAKGTTEYTKTNLTSKGQYYIKVETYIGTYNSSSRLKTDSDILGVSLAFDPVTSLSAKDVSTNGGTLYWNNPSVEFDGIEIYSGNGTTPIATLSKTTKQYSVSSLTPNTSYTYRVVTYKGTGNDRLAASATYTLTTYSSAVSSFTGSVTSSTTIRLSWTNPSSSYYNKILIYQAGSKIAELDHGTTYYEVQNLTPGTSYGFDIKTTNSKNIVSTSTTTGVTKRTGVATVTGIRSSSTGTDYKTIAWTNPAGNYSGVKVYSKLSTQSDSYYSLASTITNGSTSCTITGLSAGKTYVFKVETYLTADNTTYTAYDTFTNYTKPPAVTNLAFYSRPSDDQIRFSWTNPASATYDDVKLYYKKSSASSYSLYGSVNGYSAYTLTLERGCRYDVKLTTYYNGYETSCTALTGYATVPYAPSSVSVTSRYTQVTVSWAKPSGDVSRYAVRYKKVSASSWNYSSWIDGADTTSYNLTLNDGQRYEFQVYSDVASTDGHVSSAYSSSVYYYAPPPRIEYLQVGSGSYYYLTIPKSYWDAMKNYVYGIRIYVGNTLYTDSSWSTRSDGGYEIRITTSTLKGKTVTLIPYHKNNTNHSESIGFPSYSGETYGQPMQILNFQAGNYIP